VGTVRVVEGGGWGGVEVAGRGRVKLRVRRRWLVTHGCRSSAGGLPGDGGGPGGKGGRAEGGIPLRVGFPTAVWCW